MASVRSLRATASSSSVVSAAVAAVLVWVASTPAESASVGPRNPRFEHLSIEQGLSQAFVRTILQDRRGFLWFGTQAGLNRYDGYTFVQYAEDPDDPTALSNNLVKDLLEARNGDLWVATEGGGVDRLPFGQKGFVHYRFDDQDPASLRSDRARTLLETEDGRLWIGSDDGFLDLLEPGAEGFRHISLPVAESTTAAIRALSANGDRLWVGTEGAGLIELSTATLEIVAVHGPREGDDSALAGDSICSLLHDSDGTLWVGTCGGGLGMRRAGSEGFVTFRSDDEDPTSLCSNDVWSLYEDLEGALWVGTDGGLCEWQPRTESFYRYRHDPADPRSLADNRVAAVFQDSGGVLWLGTYDGLNYWLTSNMEFRHHTREDRPGGLTANMITSFAEAPDGDIWVGTYGGGLNRMDVETGEFTSYRYDDDRQGSLSDDRVMSLHQASDGTLWVGTFAGGLDRLAPGSDTFANYRHDPEDPTSLSTDGVTVILEDGDQLWVGTYRGGLNRLDLATGTFTRFRHSRADRATVSSDQILSLRLGRSDDLLVASEGGLDSIDRTTGAVRRIEVLSSEDDEEARLHVFSLAESPEGDLWLGTQGSGVIRWRAADRDAGRQRFEIFSTEEGLASEVAYGLLFDATGDLWVSSNEGLSRFDPTTGEVRRYDSTHGLQNDEFNFGAQLRASSDLLYFGGINGFSDFDPELVRDNTHVPPVVVTGIYRNNEPLTTAIPVTDIQHLELDHRDYVVTIEFAALDFAAPRKNRYRYRLEGLERDWIDAGNLRRATYTTLRPGNYTFRVQAANNDGYWNETGVQLGMTIAPAPWRTKSAYAGYSLALAALVGVYARGQARKRAHAAELAVTNETLKREIEQRREKERALEREKEKARTYLDVAEVIMLALDQHGRVTLINQRGCRTLGVREDEILGKTWCEEFLHPDAGEAAESFETPSPGTFEAPILTRRGERRIVVWESTALPANEDDPAGGALFSGADITEMRWLADAKEAAESASLAKSQFLANISHEIRTPMGGVLGMIELLQGTELSVTQKVHVESARRSANHLLDILNDILDFSKVEAGRLELEPTRFEICELVQDVVELFSDSAQAKALRFETSIAPDVPHLLHGDTKRLRQILANLVGNAVKFTDRGGLHLRVSRIRPDARRTWIRFEVEDTGIGIDTDRGEHIFEAFRQADGSTTRRFGGTGLGLAIARQLVEAMAGEIQFDSRPGEGSRFWFVVPLDAPRLEALGDAHRPPDSCLVALGDPDECSAVLSLLDQWGVEGVRTESPHQALETLLERARRNAPVTFALIDPADRLEDGARLLDALRSHPDLWELRVVAVGDLLGADPHAPDEAVPRLARPIRPSELFDTLYGQEGDDARLTPPPSRSDDLGGLRFLVAEDNPVMQQVVHHHLSSSGGEVERVDNGADAVKRCLESNFDAVLMDCQMPVMDGYAATRAIRAAEAAANGPHTLIIAMTAHAMSGDREKCLAAGMDDYISKPLSRDALLSLIRNARGATSAGPAPSEPAATAGAPPTVYRAVDRETLETLARSTSRGAALVEQLVALYLESTPTHLEALRRAVAADDLELASQSAHTLRSSSVTVGAQHLAELCRRVEQAANGAARDEVAELTTLLEAEYGRVSDELKRATAEVSA